MIYYRLRGHELQNDVQTMIQVFYPNLHYYRTEEISAEETTVESSVETLRKPLFAAKFKLQGFF